MKKKTRKLGCLLLQGKDGVVVEKRHTEGLWEVIMSVGYTSFCFIIM